MLCSVSRRFSTSTPFFMTNGPLPFHCARFSRSAFSMGFAYSLIVLRPTVRYRKSMSRIPTSQASLRSGVVTIKISKSPCGSI
jgi:hypothetical protein